MSTYRVTGFVNTTMKGFFGFKSEHPVAEVETYTVEATGPDRAAEALFVIGNRQGTDVEGCGWPSDVRSVSVGDMVRVREGRSTWFYACASFGWVELPEPANPVVPLAGTIATSRE